MKLNAWRHNLIHGVQEVTPPYSLHSLQNMESYFVCLLAILLELSDLRHNLIHGVPQATSLAIGPLFLKYGKLFLEKYSYCLKLNAWCHNLILS